MHDFSISLTSEQATHVATVLARESKRLNTLKSLPEESADERAESGVRSLASFGGSSDGE